MKSDKINSSQQFKKLFPLLVSGNCDTLIEWEHLFPYHMQYEYKVKGIRKKRVTIEVSTQGVKISKRKRRRVRLVLAFPSLSTCSIVNIARLRSIMTSRD